MLSVCEFGEGSSVGRAREKDWTVIAGRRKGQQRFLVLSQEEVKYNRVPMDAHCIFRDSWCGMIMMIQLLKMIIKLKPFPILRVEAGGHYQFIKFLNPCAGHLTRKREMTGFVQKRLLQKSSSVCWCLGKDSGEASMAFMCEPRALCLIVTFVQELDNELPAIEREVQRWRNGNAGNRHE